MVYGVVLERQWGAIPRRFKSSRLRHKNKEIGMTTAVSVILGIILVVSIILFFVRQFFSSEYKNRGNTQTQVSSGNSINIQAIRPSLLPQFRRKIPVALPHMG